MANAAADEGKRVETSLSIKDAFRHYRKAVAWSVAVSMSTIMESYGLLLMDSFFAFPQFKQRYGEQLPDGTYSVLARWQLALTVLVRNGRLEEAEKSLRRLCSAPDDIDPKNTIAMMSRTIETEREMNTQGSYLDCFRGENMRRTEIDMIGWGYQILPGFVI
ncbi:hypothetical protein QQX98_003739 [Neonectria punicea]|uniref:Uncharacterized protein n=1 Tax=Neonectria punicea TaxID=979145 RepID=A0ABR1HCB9_9HYPO